MNFVDILILIGIALFTLLGFKRGFTKELVSFVGFILAVVIAFLLKDIVSVWMYEHLPFFEFGGFLKGVSALNILVYEVLAFFFVFTILMIIQKVLLFATGIFEKLLNLTIVLGIFSKILGAILGLIEAIMISFVVLYVLSLPSFNIKDVNDSKLSHTILTKTPVLSSITGKTTEVIDEFLVLKEKYKGENAEQFNYDTLELFLKYKVISVENLEKLIQKGKIKGDYEDLLNKYRKEK